MNVDAFGLGTSCPVKCETVATKVGPDQADKSSHLDVGVVGVVLFRQGGSNVASPEKYQVGLCGKAYHSKAVGEGNGKLVTTHLPSRGWLPSKACSARCRLKVEEARNSESL